MRIIVLLTDVNRMQQADFLPPLTHGSSQIILVPCEAVWYAIIYAEGGMMVT
jgi:hypothetical protein